MDEPKVFVIGTAHDQYRRREFPAGSTVVDPWRMIPDQQGVTIRRLGENRPAGISILVPSRGRPEAFGRMMSSAFDTATFTGRVEIICWLDQDDSAREAYLDWERPNVRFASGPRMLLSECWNLASQLARGEILMHCGDDLTFDTPGWDTKVRQAFDETPDKILFAYGNDLGPHGKEFGTHGFLHRRWVDTVGYFVPPLFSSDWNDVWLNDVAKKIGRHRLLDFVTEHHHWSFGKSERDATTQEREERGIADGVVDLYKRTEREREADAAKLRAVMA